MEVEGEKISPFLENIFLRRRAFTRLSVSASITKATILFFELGERFSPSFVVCFVVDSTALIGGM